MDPDLWTLETWIPTWTALCRSGAVQSLLDPYFPWIFGCSAELFPSLVYMRWPSHECTARSGRQFCPFSTSTWTPLGGDLRMSKLFTVLFRLVSLTCGRPCRIAHIWTIPRSSFHLSRGESFDEYRSDDQHCASWYLFGSTLRCETYCCELGRHTFPAVRPNPSSSSCRKMSGRRG
jgi:hypothetical protein